MSLIAFAILALLAPNMAFAAGGDFSNTDFVAAASFTYNHATGGGAYNDRTVGDFNDVTEQLEGGEFACGDIVTYLAQITMEATTAEPVQTGRFDFKFLADSTGQSGAAHSQVVGVSINYGQVENGDDGTGINPGAGSFGLDSGISDDGGSTATLVSQLLTGPLFQSGSELLATVDVDDLEAGETVVLRIDTRLECDPGRNPTGNLQGQLDAGTTFPSNETINTGQQTIPFLKIGDLAGAGEPLLQIDKTVTTAGGTCGVDDVEQLTATAGDTVKYCYTVRNPGTADLFDVEVIDDNGTPGNTADDFSVNLMGLADLDGDADLGDLASGATATGEELVALTTSGTVTNTGDASGNNGASGGNFAVLTDSDTATVIVQGVPNRPPDAQNDAATTSEETAVRIDVDANDSDPDGNLDPTSANPDCSGCSLPANGTLANNGDGTFTYTPNANFNGTDSFDYEVCDTDGLCDTATVTTLMAADADPPVAVDDAATTPEDTAVTINAAANDSDVDGNLDPTSATVTSGPSNGTVTNNGDGTFTYTPDANFNGTDSFDYQICDTTTPTALCDTATVTITVDPVDDPPVAVDDAASTDEDVPVAINVAANDSDGDGNLDLASANSDCATCSKPGNGTLVDNGDGTFTYTPNADFNGADSFTYEICDTTTPDALCDTATVTITVNAVNDPPVAQDDSGTTFEDTPVTVNAAANDSDVDGNLDPTSATVISGSANGTVTNNGDGTFTYTPNADFNGEDSFNYQICDATGLCATATVTITVDPVNDPPVAANDSATTDEDTAVTIDATANDSDVDGNLAPASATVTSGPSNGTLVNNGDGTFTYTPDPDFNGSDSFDYQVCDTDGLCDSAMVDITVEPVNDPPVANDDSTGTDEDTAVTINATANDSDVDGNLAPASAHTDCATCSLPSNGDLVNNGDGTFTYTPDLNFNGSDSFVYEVCDTDGLCDSATVDILVAPGADPPVAVDDPATTPEDTAVTIDATFNDSDVDGNLAPTTATVLSDPSHGTVAANGDGTFTYTPAPDFNGPDSFEYEVCDTDGLCDSATVFITVTAVNDPPVAIDDTGSTTQDTMLTEPASDGTLGNDSDVDGDSISVVSSDAVSEYGGTVAVNADGSFSYTPASGFAGYDTFTYTISDGNGGTDTATVTIEVQARNNRSISVDWNDWTLDGTLSGDFLITNQSGNYDVQIVDLAIEAQYKEPGTRWTSVAVSGCSFDPSPNFLVVDQQLVNFSGCTLAEAIPAGATVRVTANVCIFGRIKGKGKEDGCFLSRLSK